jgi:hypothetical protein
VSFKHNGGCLSGYPKPAFQANLTPADGGRDVPDVSLFAASGFNHCNLGRMRGQYGEFVFSRHRLPNSSMAR